MTVLAYMNARLREFEGTNQLELFGSDTFDTAWFLRHQETGEILEVSQGRGGVLDLAQPALRQWMLDQIQGWLADAPFDGIAFDRVQGVSETSTVWLARIGLEKIRALNRAEIDLVNEVSTGMGSDKLFVYNGLKDASSTLEGRIHTEPLGPADGVANEYFCYHKDFAFLEAPGFSLEQSVILEIDAHLSAANDGKVVLVHVTYQDDTLSQAEKDVINRMCYGSFLLGHRPGFTSYKFGFLTTQRVLDENAAEQSIQFGEPFGAYVSLGGGLYSREFANGIVVVNLGVSPSSFQVPFASVLMNGGVAGQSFAANTTATVPARDTLFLVRQ